MNGACIPYPGCTTSAGYGLRWYKGKTRLAHRVAYCEKTTTDINTLTRSHVVKHSCDNPRCVNPNHLSLGTQADNMKERSLRAPRGEKRKLTPAQVLAIRAVPGSRSDAIRVAKEYDMEESSIRNIWTRKTWGHI